MLRSGVAACHRYGMCNVSCVDCDCMVCVLLVVWSVTVWYVYC